MLLIWSRIRSFSTTLIRWLCMHCAAIQRAIVYIFRRQCDCVLDIPMHSDAIWHRPPCCYHRYHHLTIQLQMLFATLNGSLASHIGLTRVLAHKAKFFRLPFHSLRLPRQSPSAVRLQQYQKWRPRALWLALYCQRWGYRLHSTGLCFWVSTEENKNGEEQIKERQHFLNVEVT